MTQVLTRSSSTGARGSIVLVDLGVVVPVTVAAGGGAPARGSTRQRALYGVVGWFALVPPSVTAVAAVLLARDDPHSSVPNIPAPRSAHRWSSR